MYFAEWILAFHQTLNAAKLFGSLHSIISPWRILIIGFERASVGFQAYLTVSSAEPVPLGNSTPDHSGNEDGGGGIPGNRSSKDSGERVVGEVWETQNPYHDVLS